MTSGKQRGIAGVMLPILENEMQHISSGVSFRKRNLEVSETCGMTLPALYVYGYLYEYKTRVAQTFFQTHGCAHSLEPRSVDFVDKT